MFTGLQDALDPAGLPVAARIAQLVLAGTVITHLSVLRPASARADLLLVADMVHSDLAADIRERRLPGLDPQVAELARALATAKRLSRKEVSRNAWWPTGGLPSSLTPEQQARLDGYLHQLDQAGNAYHRAVRPWWSLTPSTAPRHGHVKHAARARQASREGALERNLLFDGPAAPPPLQAPVAPLAPVSPLAPTAPPAPVGRAAVAPVAPVRPVPPKTDPRTGPKTGSKTGSKTGPKTGSKTALKTGSKTGSKTGPKTEQETDQKTGPMTKSITLAISRARGIDPADTGQLIELGQSSLGDILGRR